MLVEYASILPNLYGAALDPSKWQDFCNDFTEMTGGPIMMFGHRIDLNESLGLLAGGIDPAELIRYHEHYADKNPWMHMNRVMPPLAVGVSDVALERRELFKTEFYNDWLLHQENVVAGPAMICERSDNRLLAIAAPCRARDVDDTLPQRIETLEFLGPHIQHVIRMAVAFADSDCGDDRRFLGRLDCGAILIRRSGRVAYVNPIAQSVIDTLGLFATTPADALVTKNAVLANFIRTSIDAIRAERLTALPAPLLMRGQDGTELMIHANIFRGDDGQRFPENVWSDPVTGALVITSASGAIDKPNYEGCLRAFGATKAESKLAAALVSGLTLDEFAAANDLSGHTVRNQMRALLRKTETRSQQEFIRKVVRLANPLRELRTRS